MQRRMLGFALLALLVASPLSRKPRRGGRTWRSSRRSISSATRISTRSGPSFDPAPGTKKDLAACGWMQIAFVDTRLKEGDRGGQYGVSITAPSGSIGRYRYLLFDVFETESDNVWGNTFYSEIDVVAKE